MKILIVSPCYPPDLGPSAPMLRMLAESLVSSGNQVVVLAAVPHFPTGVVPSEYRHRIWTWEHSNGVRIGRAWIPSGNRANLVHRSLTFLIYQILVALMGLRLDYDVAFIANPAIETGLPFVTLGRMRRKPAVFGVWDVYPEVGVRMGLFRHKAVIRLVAYLEDICLHSAQRIQVLGDGFLTDLKAHQVNQEIVTVIPPWLDTNFIQPMPRKNPFSCEHGLDEKFVVLYAGNLGPSQGLEVVLDAARLLVTEPDILFVFVGDGTGTGITAPAGIRNEQCVISALPAAECLPNVLASADISLVVLKQGIGSSSLPSKLFSIFASARPALACVDEGSDAWKLIERSESGFMYLAWKLQTH